MTHHLSGESETKLQELNEFLKTHDYLSGDHPGAEDNRVFNTITGGVPSKDKYFEVHFWYLIISVFSPVVRNSWSGAQQQPKQQQQQQQQQKQEPKKETAPKKDDEVDLFGDDDDVAVAEEAKKLAEKKKAEAEAGKKKKQVIAKTVVIFEVKVYEAEDVELLNKIAKKIKEEINMPGLVWGQEVKIEEVAYGAKKLKMNMVVEDDKVLTDDVFDKILAWEDDVQSVDIVTMQKV